MVCGHGESCSQHAAILRSSRVVLWLSLSFSIKLLNIFETTEFPRTTKTVRVATSKLLQFRKLRQPCFCCVTACVHVLLLVIWALPQNFTCAKKRLRCLSTSTKLAQEWLVKRTFLFAVLTEAHIQSCCLFEKYIRFECLCHDKVSEAVAKFQRKYHLSFCCRPIYTITRSAFPCVPCHRQQTCEFVSLQKATVCRATKIPHLTSF